MGVPAVLQCASLAVIFAICLDRDVSQELPLYAALVATAGFGLMTCLLFLRLESGSPQRWLYTAVAPYHLITLATSAGCLLWLQGSAPLLSVGFVSQWQRPPRPPDSAFFIFGAAALIYLAAVFSTLVWDPDESEKEAIAPKKGRRRRKKAADDGDGDGGGEAAGVVGAAAGSRLARLRNRLPTKLARLASDSKKGAAASTQVSRL